MSRLESPDTQADQALRGVLDENSLQNFVVVAGAGSGKTTSLVKALHHIVRSCGERLTIEGRRIACVTYTEVAAEEITRDIRASDLVHISTIHSFLWRIVRSFSLDISRWVESSLKRRIEENRVLLSSSRARPASRQTIESELASLSEHLSELYKIRRWSYGTGSDYKRGVLGHSDVLAMVPSLLVEKPILAKVLAQQFPYILVDESQDTDPQFVTALKLIARDFSSLFCVGFFGDPMQQIYTAGVGRIELEPGWKEIKKPENYRCSWKVLDVLNAIRRDDDGLVQIPSHASPPAGRAQLYVLPSDDKRGERLERLRTELNRRDGDKKWKDGDVGLRVLVIAHRMAAKQLGFAALYEAANQGTPESIRHAFREGTLGLLRPICDYLIPLVEAHASGRGHIAMSLLRRHSFALGRDSIVAAELKQILSDLRRAVDRLASYFLNDATATIADVFRLAYSSGLLTLDERVSGLMDMPQSSDTREETRPDRIVDARILACPAVQVHAYSKYIEGDSPYSTQHGIKGMEYPRVIVVLDDEEGRHSLYSYDKLFHLKALSKTDSANIEQGKDNVIDRTRRLFYVCCSRAREDLVVVLYAQEPQDAVMAIRQSNTFSAEHVSIFDGL